MFENIPYFRMAYAMATHAGARQAVIARNMANADTPGFRAQDLPPFSELVGSSGAAMRATRARHLNAPHSAGIIPAATLRDAPGQSPDGNSVSLEQEMLNAVEVKRQHDRALAIYKSGMTILRSAIGRR